MLLAISQLTINTLLAIAIGQAIRSGITSFELEALQAAGWQLRPSKIHASFRSGGPASTNQPCI
jgi:hypothetical protein